MYNIKFLSNFLFTDGADRPCEEWMCGNEYGQEQICVKIFDYTTFFTADKKRNLPFNTNK